MNNTIATVPDQGPLTFKLWFPRWALSNRRATCSFEVTAAGIEPLVDGTTECMREFMSDLGVNNAAVHHWSIRRFVSPFFSDYPASNEWQDRLPLAWTVDIELDQIPEREQGESSWGPFGSYGFDESSLEVSDPGQSENDDYVVVIGVAAPGTDTSILTTVGPFTETSPGIVRIELGRLAMPNSLGQVDNTIETLHDHGFHTDWRSAH